jgi:hypothetical protein
MKTNGIKAVWAAGALGGLMLTSGMALACSLEAWRTNGSVTMNVAVGGPGEGVARYSGVCAMRTPDNSQIEYVANESPGGISQIRARFYVLTEDNASDTYDVFKGFDDQGGELFTVQLANLDGGGDDLGDVRVLNGFNNEIASCTDCIDVGFWTSIEIDWNSGQTNLDLWVNVDAAAPDAPTDNGPVSSGQSIDSVQLGNLGATPGTLTFDSYESRRTTAIGRFVPGDANNDGEINALDRILLRNEVLQIALANGQPDCNEDGSINAIDRICQRNIILGITL